MVDNYSWFHELANRMREDGRHADIDLLETLARMAFEGDYAGAQARLPGARAIAAREGPWLEVMVNHLEMQLYLAHHLVGEAALAPAVTHFERAQREDAIGCPQSICATDHLVGVYTNIDGPGWAPLCLETCDETLPRVDPRSNCFVCLTSDRALAQADAGMPEQAIVWIDAQEARRLDAGQSRSAHLARLQAELLLRLGRPDAALDVLKRRGKLPRYDDSAGRAQQMQTLTAHAHAMAGRDEEARAALPAWAGLLPSYRNAWLRAMALLCARAPTLNDAAFGQAVENTLVDYAKAGNHRHVVDLGAIAVDLALQRGDLPGARRHLALAREHQQRLQADCGAAALLQARDAAIADATP